MWEVSDKDTCELFDLRVHPASPAAGCVESKATSTEKSRHVTERSLKAQQDIERGVFFFGNKNRHCIFVLFSYEHRQQHQPHPAAKHVTHRESFPFGAASLMCQILDRSSCGSSDFPKNSTADRAPKYSETNRRTNESPTQCEEKVHRAN